MIEVVGAVIVRDGRALLTQRRAGKDFPFTWESPGGKVEGNHESHHSALRREIEEGLGVDLTWISEQTLFCGEFGNAVSRPERAHVIVLLYPCGIAPSAVPVPREGQGLGWFSAEELAGLPMAPANEAARALLARHVARTKEAAR